MNDESIPDPSKLPLDVLDEIDRLCDRFEAAWARGERPRVEDWLEQIATPYRDALSRDLLAAEIAARRRLGENPCLRCGDERPAGTAEGLCPRCLGLPATEHHPHGQADDAIEAGTGDGTEPTPTGLDATRALPAERGAETDDLLPDPASPTITTDGLDRSRTRSDLVRYFGDYEVLKELGRGGMGIVYEARQVSLNRPVALKMIKAGLLADDAELRRFQNEAEAVALLDHAGIVSVFEVGEHDGQRYFSMKLVEGGNLAERLEAFKDDFKAVAILVAEIAEAVNHAHMRGILHRDLKPANILIDIEGHPHVTDFGLAKRVEADVEMTASGAILGTPAYMSPEQANGRRGSITTATDVYGMGAILYALLTGKAPFGGGSVIETLDAVRTQPPDPPTRLNRGVPRDLETICLKCLEKDPRRRYPTARTLADDLHAWLGLRPIAARPVGTVERAWLWCRRRPAIAGLILALALASMGGVAGIAWNWREAVRQRNLATAEGLEKEKQRRAAVASERVARSEAEKAEAVVRFLVDDILAQASPDNNPRNRRVTIEEALDLGGAKIADRFAGKPEVEIAVRTMIGRTYSQLGELHKAEPHLRRALDLSLETVGEDASFTTDAMNDLATLLQHQRKLSDAEAWFRRNLKISRRVWGPTHKETISASNNLAVVLVLLDKLDEAEAMFRRVVDDSMTELGPDHAWTLSHIGNLAGLIKNRGRWAEAEPLFRKVLDAQTRIRGPEHPDTLNVLNGLGQLLTWMYETEEAEQVLRRCLEARVRVLGPENGGTLVSMDNLTLLLIRTEQWEEAEALIRSCLSIRLRRLDPENPETLATKGILATVLQNQGRFDEAESLFREVMETSRRVYGEDNLGTLKHANGLGLLLSIRDKPEAGEPLLRQTLTLRLKKQGPENSSTLVTMNTLASVLRDLNQLGEAEKLARACLTTRRRVVTEDNLDLPVAMETLASVLLSRRQVAEAETLLRESLEIRRKAPRPGLRQSAVADSLLGGCLTAQGRYAEAEPLLIAAFATLRESRTVVPSRVRKALDRIIALYEAWGKPDNVTEWQARRLDLSFPSDPFAH